MLPRVIWTLLRTRFLITLPYWETQINPSRITSTDMVCFMQRMWVAQKPLSGLIEAELEKQDISVRTLAELAGLDPRTCRDIISGRGTGGWVRVESAEKMLKALGALHEMALLDVVVAD